MESRMLEARASEDKPPSKATERNSPTSSTQVRQRSMMPMRFIAFLLLTTCNLRLLLKTPTSPPQSEVSVEVTLLSAWPIYAE